MKTKAIERRLLKLTSLSFDLQERCAPIQMSIQTSPVHDSDQIWIWFKDNDSLIHCPTVYLRGDKKIRIATLDRCLAIAQHLYEYDEWPQAFNRYIDRH